MPSEESREKHRSFLSMAILGLLSLEPVLQVLISAQSPWESELVEPRKKLIYHDGCWWDWDYHHLISWEHIIVASGQ